MINVTINFAILHSKPEGKEVKIRAMVESVKPASFRFGCSVRITRSKERNRFGLCKLNKIYCLHSFNFLFWHSFYESNQNSVHYLHITSFNKPCKIMYRMILRD